MKCYALPATPLLYILSLVHLRISKNLFSCPIHERIEYNLLPFLRAVKVRLRPYTAYGVLEEDWKKNGATTV